MMRHEPFRGAAIHTHLPSVAEFQGVGVPANGDEFPFDSPTGA
jgi:hypothetical protein